VTSDEKFMAAAIAEALKGFAEGEAAIGAVAVRDGINIASGHNQRHALSDLTAHAEMMCLRDLSSHEMKFDLSDVTIYTTLEPCAMCTGAMIHYRLGRVVFGEYDASAGACGSRYNFHKKTSLRIEEGILRQECRQLLLNHFEKQLGYKATGYTDVELPLD
jgi:tRNA(adenine34) deaminase